jgi:hypothetical protein
VLQTCSARVEHDFGSCRISIIATRMKPETSLEMLIIWLWKRVCFKFCQKKRLRLSDYLLTLWGGLDINRDGFARFYVGHFLRSDLNFYWLTILMFSTRV